MTSRDRVRLKTGALLFLLAALPAAGCYGTTGYVETDDGVYGTADVAADPTPAFVATTEPVYYDGRPTYWYGSRWNYREGGRWNSYRAEPQPLRATRTQMGAEGTGWRGPAQRAGWSGGQRSGRWR
jgi:hypothetical protein